MTNRADMPQVNQRVLEFMGKLGIPKRKIRATLASACGITGSAVQQWFTTTKNIKHEHLLSIAKEFGTSVDWLLTGEGKATHITLPDHQALTRNQVASALIMSSKDELLTLANSLEATDMEAASTLRKITTGLDSVIEIL